MPNSITPPSPSRCTSFASPAKSARVSWSWPGREPIGRRAQPGERCDRFRQGPMVERGHDIEIETATPGNFARGEQRGAVIVSAFAFGFDTEGDMAALREVEEIVNARDALGAETRIEPAAGIEPTKLGPVEIGNRANAIRGASNVCVMQHQRYAITAEPKIGLDHCGAKIGRQRVGGHRLLWCADAMSPVGDDEPFRH